MTKGFITVATGKKYYYELARNLLKSYRFFTKNPYPFTIIAEEENEFTADFDNVIITDKAQHNFMDKLLVFENLPYDETIFIDSDSLCYGDLNVYWEMFKNATDFSALGENFDVEKNETGDVWYNLEDVGKYGKNVNYRCRVHAGVMFFRKSKDLEKMYSDCLDIVANYDKYTFIAYSGSKDECSLAVASAYNNMKMLVGSPESFVFYPCCKKIKADVFTGNLSYQTPWSKHSGKGVLIHFGTPSTKTPIYRFSIQSLNYLTQQSSTPPLRFIKKLLYEKKWKLFFMTIWFKIKTFKNKVFIKLKIKK